VFEIGVSFEECYDFLVSENYALSDFVGLPGEFSTRGGIIDVFPFSSYCPYRINFLDDLPIVFRFNIDSQLTTGRVGGFILSSVSKNNPLALEDVSLEGFLPVTLSSLGGLTIGNPNKILKKIQLQAINYKEFCAIYKNNYPSMEVASGLSSVGLVDENNNVSVPLWFMDKKSIKEEGVERPVPLDLGEICRGDYLVHRDHGVGVCVGLYLNDGGASAQELLLIKYGDGGIISIDIGSLDLIAFFAPADTDGVALDSLSKKGGWARKKLSAKRRAEEIIQRLLGIYVKRRGLSRPTPFFGKRI
jgi:transcription-repair coupling factor (superfamily II helicase)